MSVYQIYSKWNFFKHICFLALFTCFLSNICFSQVPIEGKSAYKWIDPTPTSGDNIKNCGDCHAEIYNQWAAGKHAQSSVNRFFIDMYNGSDPGNNTNVQPGYRLDYPYSHGNCANCHVPVAAVKNTIGIDINSISGVEKMGITCDFCHRVTSVHLKKNTSVNTGVMMLELKHSPDNICAGMMTDSSKPGINTTEIKKSTFCASCHQGSFWGVPVYETYSEWLQSDYAEKGIQCQTCHFLFDEMDHNDIGTSEENRTKKSRVHSHLLYGPKDSTFLISAVEMNLSAAFVKNEIAVNVKIKNKAAGHFLPTGQPMRNLILLVTVTDAEGHKLKYTGENRIPVWGGRGDPRDGNWENLPGKGFAKILFEHYSPYNPFKVGTKWQHIYPASQWRNVKIKFDTRIPPLETDISTYNYQAKNVKFPVKVTAKLVYRKTFKNWANMKNWKIDDILIAQNIKYMNAYQ